MLRESGFLMAALSVLVVGYQTGCTTGGTGASTVQSIQEPPLCCVEIVRHGPHAEGKPLQGVLVSADGRPLVGKPVCLLEGRLYFVPDVTKTDSQGRFSFDVAPGEYVVAYGPLLRQGCRVEIDEGATTSLRCTVKEDDILVLRGQVNVSNLPDARAWLTFRRLDPDPARLVWPPPPVDAEIAPDGSYEATLVPGRYLVAVIVSGWTVPHTMLAEVQTGQARLDFPASECSVEGVVRDAQGASVPYGVIHLCPSGDEAAWSLPMAVGAVTDMTGTFRISHVLPGLYDFVISPFGANEGHLRSGIRVTGEKTTLSWALGRTAKVVVEAKTSTPTKALPYAMVASEEHPKLRVLHKIERKDGSAGPVPMQLPTGRYRLFGLSEEPGLSCEASLVDVTEDVNIDFTLVPAGAVKVALRGKPDEIAGRIVRLWDSDGQLVPRLYDPKWSYDYYFVPAVVFPTAYDGITTIRRIRPGRYEVSVDGAQQRRAVTVRAGETTMVSIELKQ